MEITGDLALCPSYPVRSRDRRSFEKNIKVIPNLCLVALIEISLLLFEKRLGVFPSGKILFGRSHIRDVALERQPLLDEYLKVRF